ncbi:alpha/beta fold hydrolase [Arthrobacter cryoconiti]|uniref:Alpha/beta fold hydrolase n=1 Tax=Arthrobacter cryoconiti TaxID=748907 RepID=A0ABV8R159_9MICC|nr:alpha/beta hydrolase [Arthrobacter cryoconiti]MCC9068116.1 alpha/beta hydrolase [Arthrobacter cryoconiti]
MTRIDTTTSTHTLTSPKTGKVDVSLTERGHGHPFLLLHGGAGPQSVTGFAELLTTTENAHVIIPTHPGFGGTPRPEGLTRIAALAEVYSRLLDELDLIDVTVIGNSIGGWIAAEMALLGSERISSVVLVDAVGLQIDAHPIVDFFSLTMDQVASLSYYQPEAFRFDVTALPEPQKALMGANRAALLTYGGTTMADPGLLERLPAITVATLVIWGAADRIVPPEHGRAYADSIPNAQFHLIHDAGHLPQLETPDQLHRAVWNFADKHATNRP